MIKKDYLQPSIEVVEINTNIQILAGSIKTTGLDGDDLTEDTTPVGSPTGTISRPNTGRRPLTTSVNI